MSCYLEGEKVAINVLSKRSINLEIYKDGALYIDCPLEEDEDVTLYNLFYGNFKVRVVFNNVDTGIVPLIIGKRFAGNRVYSDFICWKVVNTEADDKNNYISRV